MKLLLLLAHNSRFWGIVHYIGMVKFVWGLNIYIALKYSYMVVVQKKKLLHGQFLFLLDFG